jgi:hypothetical protein
MPPPLPLSMVRSSNASISLRIDCCICSENEANNASRSVLDTASDAVGLGAVSEEAVVLILSFLWLLLRAGAVVVVAATPQLIVML